MEPSGSPSSHWRRLRRASTSATCLRRTRRAPIASFLRVGGHLHVDYSKNLITQDSMTALFELARKTGVEALRDQMFAGEPDQRHRTACGHARGVTQPLGPRPMPMAGRDVMPDVRSALEHMRAFSEAVRSGQWLGYTGLRITDVVNIGIGGSDLGPGDGHAGAGAVHARRTAHALRVERRRRAPGGHVALAASGHDALHRRVEDLHHAGDDGQRAIRARVVPGIARRTRPPSPSTSSRSRPTRPK